MDRNEVILVGRLPEAAHIRLLPSGSRLGTWRLIVRRQHRGRGARVDTIPCASFELEVIEAVAGWLPDDIVEVTGSLRRRWWGSEGSKSSGYEVEVCSVRRLERRVTTILTGDEGAPVPAPPRSMRSLLHAEPGDAGQEDAGQGDAGRGDAGLRDTGQEHTGQGAEPRLTSAKPGLTSAGPALAPTGPDSAPVEEPNSVLAGPVSIPPVGPNVASVGSTSAPVGSNIPSAGPASALAGPNVTSFGSTSALVGSDITSAGRPDSALVGPDVTSVGSDLVGPDSVPVRPGPVPVGWDSGPGGPGLTPVGRDPALAGPDNLSPPRSDLAPEEGAAVAMPVAVPVQRAVEASVSGRSRAPHLATRADAVSGANK
ncbi:hypothetical protein [Streptosporangium sp. NPDC002524]|uniref:hypothetical protein n=1 Tax=Streptosporangium sp. NPDC002524 TaxID=3154537 RepID=UPI00332952E1